MYLRQRLPYPTHPNSRGSEQDGPTTLSLRSLSAWFDGVRQSRTQPLQQTLRKPGSPTTRTPASQHHDDAEFKLWISDDFSLSVTDREETIFETAVGVGRGGAPTPAAATTPLSSYAPPPHPVPLTARTPTASPGTATPSLISSAAQANSESTAQTTPGLSAPTSRLDVSDSTTTTSPTLSKHSNYHSASPSTSSEAATPDRSWGRGRTKKSVSECIERYRSELFSFPGVIPRKVAFPHMASPVVVR